MVKGNGKIKLGKRKMQHAVDVISIRCLARKIQRLKKMHFKEISPENDKVLRSARFKDHTDCIAALKKMATL